MDVRDTLTDFICRELLFNERHRAPTLDQPLLGAVGGVVDSVGLHQLVMFIETQFNVRVDDLDIVPENFETLRALVAFVQSKQKSST